ncbi:MAG: electron transport complex subunit RsxE, partial [Candidatus Omnitrophota bacterium]
FASKNTVGKSLLDALGMGLGFSWGLFLLGSIREFLGAGTILGMQLLPTEYNPLVIMILPAGAFIVLGFLVATMNKVEKG